MRRALVPGSRIPVLFLIRALSAGGAERQLVELVKALDKTRFAITVVTFYDGGALRPEMQRQDGVRLISLHKTGRWDVLPFLYRLWRTVLRVKPRIVHGYLGAANELSSLLAWTCGARAVWGIRESDMDLSCYDWARACSFRVGGRLSRFAGLIIVNSQSGRRHHVAHGYCGRRMVVIRNGIDTQRFRPDRDAGRRMRSAWGIADHVPLVGVVGRLDPMKDHPTFLRAAGLLARERSDVHFVCVGDGPAVYKRQLQALAAELGLRERLIWAGHCEDMVAAYNALQVATSSSSFGEGFSNAIAEAMACGIACVVTDVGDSADIIGDAGEVVPPKGPQEMKAAWERLLDLTGQQRASLSQSCRQRIIRDYGVKELARKTEAAFDALLQGDE